MDFKLRRGKKQHLATLNARDRALSARDSEVLKNPEQWKKSWSARNPAYANTPLCPVEEMKKNNRFYQHPTRTPKSPLSPRGDLNAE